MHNQKTVLLPNTVPSLLRIQRVSFCWFLESGFLEVLEKFGFIDDYSDIFRIAFVANFFKLSAPIFSLKYARKIGPLSYSTQIITKLTILEKESKRKLTSVPILLSRLPLLTNEGSIYLNGTERIIISQLTRGPGTYYSFKKSKRKQITTVTLLPASGPWLDFNLTEKLSKVDDGDIQLAIKFRIFEVPVYYILRLLEMHDDLILEKVKCAPLLFNKFFRLEYNSILDELICSFVISTQQVTKFFSKEEAVQAIVYYNFFDPRKLFLSPLGRRQLISNLHVKVSKTAYALTREDIVGVVNDLVDYHEGNNMNLKDIDHIGKKKARAIGELLQIQVQIALIQTHNLIRSNLVKNRSIFRFLSKNFSPILSASLSIMHAVKSLYSTSPIESSFKELLNSSPLSQFMDQINPLASIKQKRKVSLLGSGGLSADQSRSTRVRNIHPSQYGRICTIETDEGSYAGIVNILSINAKINGFGLLVTSFQKVDNRHISYNTIYFDAKQEEKLLVATGDQFIDDLGFIKNKYVRSRLRNEPAAAPSTNLLYKAPLPVQNLAVGASLNPFLEHNDAIRTLMASNMQRQSLGLIYPILSVIGTGLEWQIIGDSSSDIKCFTSGKVIAIKQTLIVIQTIKKWKFLYTRRLCERSNQQMAIYQRLCVAINEKVTIGQSLATGTCSMKGEFSIGQNVLVAYLPWYGFNFEDAVIINERLIRDDIYTSLHVNVLTTTVCYTDLGPEEITKDIPEVATASLNHLDSRGLPYIGTWVTALDILCGKITPINLGQARPEIKLMRAVLALSPYIMKDSSLRLPIDVKGRVTRFFVHQHTMTEWEASRLGAIQLFIEVEVTQRKRIEVGDKMSGRHGNKGVISIVAPVEDMPHLHDGTPVDIILNPLGVPSRMNVGQIYECLLGWASETLGVRVKVIPFDEAYSLDASYKLINKQLLRASPIAPWRFSSINPGKVMLCDGKTGLGFQNPVTVGISYFLKLSHLVSKKIHARATGPYSIITQQPLQGRTNNGGQKLGEMEVWALEAYGAATTLHEFLTVKSDDISGRFETARALFKGANLPIPGISETFRVLIRELQALCLDVSAYKVGLTVTKRVKSVEIDLFSDILL